MHRAPLSTIPLLTRTIARFPQPVFVLYAAVAAFTAYFAMYGFRKPFTAGTFEGEFLGTGIALKTSFVLSQIFGYTLSKYIGVKVCSEAGGMRRSWLLVSFIVAAEAALILFGLLPGPWKALAIFVNGLPLGMVWGLVVSFLEGRRCSDALLAALCGSFIVSSGVVKDVGRWLRSTSGSARSGCPPPPARSTDAFQVDVERVLIGIIVGDVGQQRLLDRDFRPRQGQDR